MSLEHIIKQGFAKEDFIKWYWENYNTTPNDLPNWLIEDQLNCLSKFFGKKLLTANDLKRVIAIYNTTKETINTTNQITNKFNRCDENGWIKILSENDFPKEEFNLMIFDVNNKSKQNRTVGRKTMWQLYKQGKVTHYRFVLPTFYLPPII